MALPPVPPPPRSHALCVLLTGDFNWMFMRRGSGVTQNAKMDLPNGWQDAWSALRGEQLGATFDQPAQGRGACQVGGGELCVSTWRVLMDRPCQSRAPPTADATAQALFTPLPIQPPFGPAQDRFDRVLFKLANWEPTAIELVGTDPLSDRPLANNDFRRLRGVWPSDHFGLLATFRRKSGASSGTGECSCGGSYGGGSSA